MRAEDITAALGDVGKKWTRQAKAEERRASSRQYRSSMYAASHVSLREVCFERMEQAWEKASGGGRLPTHWRQVFYVMRPLVDGHPETDRPLIDATFKNILEEYLVDREPHWDVLRGARGTFKEPHRARDDNGLAMSTMNVRNYLAGAGEHQSADIAPVPVRFPTAGAANRIAAVLICEKEGFDELLSAEGVPERFDLALMSTKGISARAARDLAQTIEAPCFTLHDLDKNGFVMAAGFPFATDLGLRMEDVQALGLESEEQSHRSPHKAFRNLLHNGATPDEAHFISHGQRVELNMLAGPEFVAFVEGKLREHGIKKVIPDDATLKLAWERAHKAQRLNEVIAGDPVDLTAPIPPMPADMGDLIAKEFERDDKLPWDIALYCQLDTGDDGEATA